MEFGHLLLVVLRGAIDYGNAGYVRVLEL